MGILTRIAVLAVLAAWSLAAMHCRLEALPGLEFLKICCFVDSSAPASHRCDNDGCDTVEHGKYRAEEQSASAPGPALSLVLAARVMEVPPPKLQPYTFASPHPPPDLPKAWQFSLRAALPPRAPSAVG